jgi:hypothetical protein
MIFKNLFRKKQDHSDYGKLMSGMIFLSKKTQEYFSPDEFENLNPMELGIFFGAFNSACYLILRENPSKADHDKFTQHIASTIVDNVLDKDKIADAPDLDIHEFVDAISKLYSKRLNEYISLIKKEVQKPRGTSSYVDITCGILNNLYETEATDDERYDPLFAVLLSNHISAFNSILTKNYS